MRSTFLPSISPFPSPVDSVFTRSQSAWESKSLVKSSRRGSVAAGSPARTAAMIRRYLKGLLRRFLLPGTKIVCVRPSAAKTASGARVNLVLFGDGARHGQDRRCGAGAPLSDPSRPLAGLEGLGCAEPALREGPDR